MVINLFGQRRNKVREIKFRAWLPKNEYYCNDKTNKMYRVYSINDVSCEIVVDGLCNTVLKKYLKILQYTGIKDKNGKEIWEGDIIKLPKDKPMEVVMHYGMYSLKPNDDSSYHFSVAIVALLKGKVIGNIYENPELLK